MKKTCILIPAVKKNVAFADDLVKKLAGVSLIQRAIGLAKGLVSGDRVFVLTDSEEISLICERNDVERYYRADLNLDHLSGIATLRHFFGRISRQYEHVIVLSPYAPLVTEEDLVTAYSEFVAADSEMLVTVKKENHLLFQQQNGGIAHLLKGKREPLSLEVRAFLICCSGLLLSGGDVDVKPYPLPKERALEIQSFQDWWVCEKLLLRRRILFRVIGNEQFGMGHIYRALSLAHEITDHEILFLCDTESQLAVNQIAGYDYVIESVSPKRIEERILELNPDLVVNDILSTTEAYVRKLKQERIKVVNFEDLGSGAAHADLVINEIYEEPRFVGDHVRWGYRYFSLRDEFQDARPHPFAQRVTDVLLCCGGTDPSNLTEAALRSIEGFCREQGLRIFVVSGRGYLHRDRLLRYIEGIESDHIQFTSATGVISSIMEQCQIAITSNGRTVYELAHMNIPAIVVSHHSREATHSFSVEQNGFVNLGEYRPGMTEGQIQESFARLVLDAEFRRELYSRSQKYDFRTNKQKVVSMITGVLEGRYA